MAALRTVRELLELSAAEIAQGVELGRRLVAEKRWRAAEHLLRGISTLDPEDVTVVGLLAIVLVERDALDDARAVIAHGLGVVGVAPRRAEERAWLLAIDASLSLRAEDVGRALALLDDARRLAPHAPWMAHLSASRGSLSSLLPKSDVTPAMASLLERRLQEVRDGHRTLAWAFGYNDEDMMTLFDRATETLRMGRIADARRMFEGLVALDPSVPLFHLALAAAASADSDVDTARHAFDDAVRVARAVQGGEDLVARLRLERGMFLLDVRDPRGRDDVKAAIDSGLLDAEERERATAMLAA